MRRPYSGLCRAGINGGLMELDLLRRLNAARSQRQACVLVTRVSDSSAQFLTADAIGTHPLASEIEARLQSGKSGLLGEGEEAHFVNVRLPAPRLIIIGAAHISQALYPMAQSCGFDVTIIDPRTAFATPERFGNVALHAEWPESVLDDVALDPFTALAAVTHDPKIDDQPLERALAAGCFYVGALGSRKTHLKRRDRLMQSGVGDEDIDRIDAPIGLDIGAAGPAEIAVAILAQIIEKLRKRAV